MPDNQVVIQGASVSADERATGQMQRMLDGDATIANVIVASVGTTALTAALPAIDVNTCRQRVIMNTGSSAIEINPSTPAQGFVWGNGFPLAVGTAFSTNYSGAIYALVQSGTGELRAWAEA